MSLWRTGALRQLARANVVRARDARCRGRDGTGPRRDRYTCGHGRHRRTEDSRNRHSVGARRRATATRTDVPAGRPRTQRNRRGGGSRRCRCVEASDVVAAVGICPMDPAAYAAALGVTLAAAALASYFPARRAATIDPMLTM